MVLLETHQAISENNPSSRSEMASLNKTYQINRTEEKWSMSRLCIKPSLKRIDPEEKKWCPSRLIKPSLRRLHPAEEKWRRSRPIKLSLLYHYRLIKPSLRTIHSARTRAQTREGTRVPVETVHSDASSAGMSRKGDSVTSTISRHSHSTRTASAVSLARLARYRKFEIDSDENKDAPDSDHDATLSDGAPSRNPRGPQPDTEPEDTEPEDQAELTDNEEEEREVPLSAWVHLLTNHCQVNSKQDNIICGKLKSKCRLRLHKELQSSGERAAPRWYEGVPSTKDIYKETGEFIIHGQQYDEEEEHDDTDVNTSKVDSEGQFLDGSDDDHQDDLDQINELIAEIEEAKLKKLKAEKARLEAKKAASQSPRKKKRNLPEESSHCKKEDTEGNYA
ncbi:unnamed protein product [Cylindrotheca closterium]|uniref:Uncharacterized protein n=1 Tax=Cylindrotheca closterium TaxID=2856 RepID=A0AAD2CVC6_9STRA|nr:unnamed protein product [Cylindrotheca closterium]